MVRCRKRRKSCRSPARKRGAADCTAVQAVAAALSGECNRQYRHGERTKAAIAEERKFSALLKMLRAEMNTKVEKCGFMQFSSTWPEPLAMCYADLAGGTVRGRPALDSEHFRFAPRTCLAVRRHADQAPRSRQGLTDSFFECPGNREAPEALILTLARAQRGDLGVKMSLIPNHPR